MFLFFFFGGGGGEIEKPEMLRMRMINPISPENPKPLNPKIYRHREPTGMSMLTRFQRRAALEVLERLEDEDLVHSHVLLFGWFRV